MVVSRNHHTGRRSPGGFSAIELVLVLATIGIVAAMALPRYASSLSHYRARCGAQRLAGDLAAVAADAVNSSASRKVQFDRTAGTYLVSGMSDPTRRGGTSDWLVHLGREPWSCTLVSVDLGGDETIIFDGHGRPDSGGTIVVAAGHFARTVRIDPVTGRTSVQ